MQHRFGSDDFLPIPRDPLLWDAPVILTAGEIRSIAAEVRAEAASAKALCDTLLTGSSGTWKQRVSEIPAETRTPGLVLELLERVPALLQRRPADALEATAIAVAVAEALNPQKHWPDHVVIVRGQALREHAWVLSFFDRHDEALKLVEHAERTFAQIDAMDFDLERLAVVKAKIVAEVDVVEHAAGDPVEMPARVSCAY